MSRAPRLSGARRDWGTDDSATPIVHVDMDAFFAEVELLRRPALRGRPVIVGGEGRGVVLSATYEARVWGVHAAMPVHEARALCPTAVVLPPDHERYRSVSREVMAILASVTPVVEQVSIDEAFLDVSGARRRIGRPVEIGSEIRRRIREELGVPASVGIAGTKLVAKLASAHAKPNGLLLVPGPATVDFLHALPVGALWGVGPAMQERLVGRGLSTVGDLAHAPLQELQSVVGRIAGRRLLDLSWGRDPRAVEPVREEKSVGAETTFAEDLRNGEEILRVLLEQCGTVAARLRRKGHLGRTVSIKVRMANFTTLTRSQTLDQPTDLAREIYGVARRLFAGVAVPASGVRLVGMRMEQLVSRGGAPLQLQLTGEGGADWRRAEGAIDDVRARFGRQAVTTGSLVRPPATTATVRDIS